MSGPAVFISISMPENRALNNYIFDVVMFTTLTPLSLLFSCKISLPTVCFNTHDSSSFSIEIT